MRLITRGEWGARSPKGRSSANLSSVPTCHWNGPKITIGGSATWDHSRCAGLVRGIQNFHMDGRGWNDIAYNFVVCPHGYTFEGRGLNIINGANGTNTANRTSHAVMCLAGEDNAFTDTEKNEFRECIQYIDAHTEAPNRCIGHRDHKSTACPGDERYDWVHQGMPGGSAPAPAPPVSGDMPSWWQGRNLSLKKPMMRGSDVGWAQHNLWLQGHGGADANGEGDEIFGPATERAVISFQRERGLSDDGIIGPNTARALGG